MRSFEDMAAEIIENTLAREESRVLGKRRRRDALDGTGVLVDFTYDQAIPPLALEVTTAQDDSFLSAASAARKLAERLSRRAQAEALTPFMFTVSETTTMRRLDSPLLELMRSGRSIRPGVYSSDDLRTWEKSETLQQNLDLHRTLQQLGVADAEPVPYGRDVIVSTYGESHGGWAPAGGLENIVSANLAKLVALGQSHETHLVIGIGKYRVSQSSDATPVPQLPPGLDRLWLVHLWTDVAAMQVWSVMPGEVGWRVHAPHLTAR